MDVKHGSLFYDPRTGLYVAGDSTLSPTNSEEYLNMTKLTDKNGVVLRTHGCGRCSVCQTVKPSAEFYNDRHRSCGLSSRCKACDQERFRTLPKRTLTRDLKTLLKRHPTYRPMLEDFAAQVAA